MIQEPPIDTLAEKMGSKYALCVVAAKRARQIQEQVLQSDGMGDNSGQKPLTLAAKEIYEGKLVVSDD